MIKKKTINFKLNHKDLEILLFYWKWIYLDKDTIHKNFFTNQKLNTAYRRLRLLLKHGYLEYAFINFDNKNLFKLSRKGFLRIKDHLPHLRKNGFMNRENPEHEFYLSKFILNFSNRNEKDYTLISKQELLRQKIFIDHKSKWIDQETSYLADGYLKSCDGLKIAFEFPYLKKKRKIFSYAPHFYNERPKIKYVIWLVRSKDSFHKLKKLFKKEGLSLPSKHLFVNFKDFKSKGVKAKFRDGLFKHETVESFINCIKSEPGKGWEFGGKKLGIRVNKTDKLI